MKALAKVLTIATTCAACSQPQTTTTPAAATTIAAPTAVETFAGSLQIAGSVFYSFVVGQNGTVNVTLAAVTVGDLPQATALGLGIGTPSGTGCGNVTPVTALPGVDPQVTGTYAPGRYCVQVSDVGNLGGPVTFSVTIAHP